MRPHLVVLVTLVTLVTLVGFAASGSPALAEGDGPSAQASAHTANAVPLGQRFGTATGVWHECRNLAPAPRALGAPDAEQACVERTSHLSFVRVADGKPQGGDGAGQGGGADDLAMQLNNPLAALISVPIQANLDEGYGPGNSGYRWTINIQPVVPFKLSRQWNLISRTILPLIAREGILPNEDDLLGLGDLVQAFWLSPTKTEPIVWGVGPVFLLPTATDAKLGADKWGAGPTVIALKQSGEWTYGLHANHIWSFADVGRRGTLQNPKVNTTFLQPFVSYTFPSAFSLALSSEAIYDWENDAWSVPLILTCTQVTTICRQPVSIGFGVRYWAETPDGGPEWGIRLQATFLFPKK